MSTAEEVKSTPAAEEPIVQEKAETNPAEEGAPAENAAAAPEEAGVVEESMAEAQEAAAPQEEGAVDAADEEGSMHTVTAPGVAVFGGQGDVTVTAGADGADILYCEGQPIGEPVEKYGPFVMNTRDELQQAVDDFNSGKLATG